MRYRTSPLLFLTELNYAMPMPYFTLPSSTLLHISTPLRRSAKQCDTSATRINTMPHVTIPLQNHAGRFHTEPQQNITSYYFTYAVIHALLNLSLNSSNTSSNRGKPSAFIFLENDIALSVAKADQK